MNTIVLAIMAFRLDGNALTTSAFLLVSPNNSAELLQLALEVARLPVPPTLHLSGVLGWHLGARACILICRVMVNCLADPVRSMLTSCDVF